MNRTRIVLLGILAVLVAVWVSSATLPPPSAPAPAPVVAATPPRAAHPPRAGRARDVTSFDLNEAAERLRAHVDVASRPRAPERNPFEFAPVHAPRVAATSLSAALPAAAPMPAAPLPPPFTLTGIAEQRKDDGVERTAILTGNNQIYFAKPGDRVLGRYEVTAVGADAIELRDLEAGQIVRLGLR